MLAPGHVGARARRATASSRPWAPVGSWWCPRDRPTRSSWAGRGVHVRRGRPRRRRRARRAPASSAPTRTPTLPTPDGLVPGAGALLAAVATAAEAKPEVAGKPHRPTADAIAAGGGGRAAGHGGRPPVDRREAGGPARHSLRAGAFGRHPGRVTSRPTPTPAVVAAGPPRARHARPSTKLREEVLASS